MFYSKKYLFFLLTGLILLACAEKKIKVEVKNVDRPLPVSIDSSVYNVVIVPSQKNPCPFIGDRGLDTIFYNAPYVFDSSDKSVLKSAKGDTYPYRRLWVCNLPDYFKHNDTILITGKIYTPHGDEKLKGMPTMLIRILAGIDYIDMTK